jgi:hypothetical protein
MCGGSLPKNLSKALSESRALVVCWSEKAAHSPWVEKEIMQFRDLGHEHRIAIVHVAGGGPTVKHAALSGLEPVEHDLRRGWRGGLLTPTGKTELLRLIAFLTGVEMRVLRNWARRRAFRNMVIALAVAILPLAGILSLPLPTWDPLSLSYSGESIEPIACEVVDGKLWVASWSDAAGEVSGTRAYFMAYPDVLNDAGKQIPRPQSFTLPKRALPKTMVNMHLMDRVTTVLEESGVSDQLKRLPLPDVLRVAEPRPDHFVLIQPFGAPEDQDLKHAAIDNLPISETTGAVIVVYEKNTPPRISTVNGFAPPRWRERTADRKRRMSPSRGISVAWLNNGEIWIGVPGEREIPGGLWHSADAGKSWKQVDDFVNVTSIDSRMAANGEKETVMVAEQSFKRLRGTEFIQGKSRVQEQVPDGSWMPSEAPPHGTDSEIEICGNLADGRLHVRVDKQIYQQGTRPLFRSVIKLWGSFSS